MSCKPTYKGIRYNSLKELYEANGITSQQKQKALGFKSNLKTSLGKELEYKDEYVPTNRLKDFKQYQVLDEKGNDIGSVVIEYRGSKNVILHPKLKIEGKGYGKDLYKFISNKFNVEIQEWKEGPIANSSAAKKMWDSLEKEGTAKRIIDEQGDNFRVLNYRQQITPQQKQEAQKLYSQYIEQGGSKQDIEGFKDFVQGKQYMVDNSERQDSKVGSQDSSSSLLLSPSISNNPITLTSEAQLLKDKSFRGLPIQFVSEIRGDSNIGASLVNRSKILVNLTALKEKFNTKAWTKSREGWEDLITYPEDQFKTFDEWLTFAMLHEYSHSKIFRQEGESVPNYKNRINNNAMKILNEISAVQLELDFNENITEKNKVYETDVLKSTGKFPFSIKGNNTYSVEFINNTSKESYPISIVNDLVYSLNKNNKGKEKFVYNPTEKEGYYVINRAVVPTIPYFENKSENISNNLC